MPSSLIHGKYVICKITGPSSATIINDGAVYQKDGRIKEVGDYRTLKAKHPDVEDIGSRRFVVMPGLINSHYHTGVSFFQLGQPDKAMESFSLAGPWDLDPYLEHLYGAIQMLETGTTTVQVIYDPGRGFPPIIPEHTDKVIKAYLDAGMRLAFAPEVVDQNTTVAGARGGEEQFSASLPPDLRRRFWDFLKPGYLPVEELIARHEDVFSKYSGASSRLNINVAPGNVHRCSDTLLTALKDLAVKHDTSIHIHVVEVYQQRLYGQWAWKKTPVGHLQDLRFLGPEVDCVHSVWATEKDIDVMARHGVFVATNPSSNLRLQAGVTPLARLRHAGVRVSIGTDEAGLNDDKDLLQEMRLVHKLHRVPGTDARPLTSYEVFQMVWENGAASTGFADSIGALEPGRRADMLLMDLGNIEAPLLDPSVSIIDGVLYRGRGVDVDTVVVDGEVVMKGKRLTKIDKKALYKELAKTFKKPPLPQKVAWRELRPQIEPYLQRFFASTGTTQEMPKPFYAYNGRE
ncbi:MAG: amidohydrolase family protein [SAR202 cluster bacterium]|nr:amidohydrolase family protein [SAR202 cluster bacterium]